MVHAVVLSVLDILQAFGIFIASVFAGPSNLNVLTANVDVAQALRDLRHVALDALIAWGVGFVMCVGFQHGCVQSGGRFRTVAIQAQVLRGFAHESVVCVIKSNRSILLV